MDTSSSSSVLTNNEIPTTADILLACITNRLKKYTDGMPDSIKDVIKGFLKKHKSFKQIEQKSMECVKVLCPQGRTYNMCGAEKYKDGKKFIQYLEQHPTYRLSKLHNNNVTWYQISELVQFTVDLVEEYYEVGRTELVQFIIDWCVSFINQQSCIYTSDGWAEVLTILPGICDPCNITVSIQPLSVSSEHSPIEKKELTFNKDDFLNLPSSGTPSVLPDRPSPEALSPDEREKAESYQEDISDGEAQGENSKSMSMKKTRLNKKHTVKKTHSSTRDAAPAVTSKLKELFLLKCSCGNINKTRYGNFLGLCDDIRCSKATCLLCCSTFIKRSSFRHLAWHQLHMSSVITKEHIDKNSELFTSICFNCENKSCIQDSSRRQNTAICKLCDMHFCTYPGCRKMGKYSGIKCHQKNKHPIVTATLGKFAAPKSETSGRSKELQLLRCGCGNIDSIERHGKFWSKCGIKSCDYYRDYICLICGRTCKSLRNYLNVHLGQHETHCNGQVTAKHVEANLKLYNKVCGKCGQQSSCKYNTLTRQTTSTCRCCNAFLCMFPGCEMYYSNGESGKHHYIRMHR